MIWNAIKFERVLLGALTFALCWTAYQGYRENRAMRATIAEAATALRGERLITSGMAIPLLRGVTMEGRLITEDLRLGSHVIVTVTSACPVVKTQLDVWRSL